MNSLLADWRYDPRFVMHTRKIKSHGHEKFICRKMSYTSLAIFAARSSAAASTVAFYPSATATVAVSKALFEAELAFVIATRLAGKGFGQASQQGYHQTSSTSFISSLLVTVGGIVGMMTPS
jgi:hypothetical protein